MRKDGMKVSGVYIDYLENASWNRVCAVCRERTNEIIGGFVVQVIVSELLYQCIPQYGVDTTNEYFFLISPGLVDNVLDVDHICRGIYTI